MENKNKSREQLEREIDSLQMENNSLITEDRERRTEFSKAFFWLKPKTSFSIDPEDSITSSWEQIFVKIGKLLEIEIIAKDKTALTEANEKIGKLLKREVLTKE